MTTKDLGMVTAYAYAVMGGYEGTEAEFEALLGNIATDLEEIENLTVIANTLPEGSSATASYADGVLTLGIPKGDTGATGAGATVTAGTTTTGNPGTNASVTNSGTAKDAVFNFTIPRGDTGNGIESIYLTGTSGAVKTYTILFTDGNTTTFDVTDGEVTNASLAEVLEDYAKTDGAYESMTVGNAEQLISSVTVNDKVPYNFRTSGGSIDIGNREVDKLVGGTVAWNQLEELPTSVTWKFDIASGTITNGVAEFTPSARYGRFETQSDDARPSTTTGHKYIALASVKLTTATNLVLFQIRDYAETATKAQVATASVTSEQTLGTIYNETATGKIKPRIIDTRTSGWDKITVSNIMFIDLTQLFGSTIADYIYSLEQANAGAGVAWFKKLFPKDYYAYNAGQLMSVKTSAHQMVGFNAWDEVAESGLIGISNGQNANGSGIRSKNYCKCVPSTSYYCLYENASSTSPLYIFWYDADKNYISYDYKTSGGTTTSPQNAQYFRIRVDNISTYNNDICINLSWDGERDGEYEPYVKHEYALDSDLELRGIPKLDASNNLYYDGDTYESDGTVTRKYAIVDLGTLTPIVSTLVTNGATIPISDAKIWDGGSYLPNGIVVGYTAVKTNESFFTGGKEWTIRLSTNAGGILIADPSWAGKTANEIKASLDGVYYVYELATPTTEEADPYQNPQIVDDFGTEEYVDERTVAIPVGHDTEYMNNLKAKLEMAPDSPDGDGDYVLRQTNGENSYVPLMKELPTLPSEDGTYVLKCTVSGSTKTLGWVEEE